MKRLIMIGSASSLTRASHDGPFIEGVDPTDRWGDI
jgi:hypothetical protein